MSDSMHSSELNAFILSFTSMNNCRSLHCEEFITRLTSQDLTLMQCEVISSLIWWRLGPSSESRDVICPPSLAQAFDEIVRNSPLREVITFDGESNSLRYHDTVSVEIKKTIAIVVRDNTPIIVEYF